MQKFMIRLAMASAVALGFGATALADGSGRSSIELTGPFSTNIISSSSSFLQRLNTRNFVNAQNFNHQFARSGDVRVFGNTLVLGSGLGSGNAINVNSGRNNINIDNNQGGSMWWWGGSGSGSGGGSIFLTGPGSFNAIHGNNSLRFTSNISNRVNAQNFSTQTARSGNVTVTGNTLVTGVGGSGNAENFNQGSNEVNISNEQGGLSGLNFGSGSGGGGSIAVTGPGSFNAISHNNRTSVSQTISNNVNAQNFNRQTAQSGNVTISGNTVVSGVGGSGDATNWNSGMNDVGISNNQ